MICTNHPPCRYRVDIRRVDTGEPMSIPSPRISRVQGTSMWLCEACGALLTRVEDELRPLSRGTFRNVLAHLHERVRRRQRAAEEPRQGLEEVWNVARE